MEVFNESINATTAGSVQTACATGGIGVADEVDAGVRFTTEAGDGVVVETKSRKFWGSGVGVGFAELPKLQPASRRDTINTRNVVFVFTMFSSLYMDNYIPYT
jgi:hypothetical protein